MVIRLLKSICGRGPQLAMVTLAMVWTGRIFAAEGGPVPGSDAGLPASQPTGTVNASPGGESSSPQPQREQYGPPASAAPTAGTAANSGKVTQSNKCEALTDQKEKAQCETEKKCAGAFDDARTACADTMGLGNMINSAAGTASGSASNIQQQCEKAAKLQELSALLNGGKAVACGYMIWDCMSACPKEPPTATSTTETNNRRCSNYKVYVAQMAAQAGAGLMAAMQSGQCKDLASAIIPPLSPISPPTIAVPSIPPYAAVDCSANPNDPTCQTCLQNPTATGCGSTGPATAGLGGTTNPGAAGAGYKSTIDENPPIDANVKPVPPGPRGSDQAGGGGGGGGFGGGSSSQKLNGDDGGRAPSGAGVNTSVLGGPLPGGGGYNYGKGAAGGSDSRNPFAGAWDKLKNKFSLKGMIPTNSRAGGMDGKAADVTGAGGPSIWEKINIQYATQTVPPLP